jgi:DMSO reductase iron-sulfur subunit
VTDQVGFVVEQNRCMGCKACQTACKDKNDLEVGQRWRRVTEVEDGAYYNDNDGLRHHVFAFWTSLGCNHCLDPRCVKNCPTGAMNKRKSDGVVSVDRTKCIGCRYCEWSCPYGAPQFNPEVGQMGKCDYCIDLVQEGKQQACVAACPVRALHAGKMDALKKKYGDNAKTKGLPDQNITNPSLIVIPHKYAIE